MCTTIEIKLICEDYQKGIDMVLHITKQIIHDTELK